MGLSRRVAPAIAFGRHIPLSKLLRRVVLMACRRLWDRTGWPVFPQLPPPPRAVDAPKPIFAPRIGGMTEGGDRTIFHFLDRPYEMAGAIDWRLPEDQLWRMNLHYMVYLEGVNDTRFLALCRQWIAANPPNAAGAWRDAWNSYALSLRVVVWMQQIAAREFVGEAAAPLVASLATQVRFLTRNLETDLGGNHLIKNIKALLWASTFFDGPEATRWRAIGLRLLKREISAQILPDGVHYERSPSYHCQVFADLLECRVALGPDSYPPELDDALRRMAQAAADLTHPDGFVAEFNDSGLTMAYAPAECLGVWCRLSGAAPLLRIAFTLPDAGYYGFRVGGNYFIADCGRIAPDDLPAHGHGDVLSFEWSVGGRRVVIDQGVFEYVTGAKRAASRSASSHNTLCFADADQADFFGAFRCGRRPNVHVIACEACDDRLILEGAHDGFANLPNAPRHVRRFEVTSDGIIIIDKIESVSDRPARVGFLLHPDVETRLVDGGARLRIGDHAISVACDALLVIEDSVWWPDMGHECATRRLVAVLPAGAKSAVTRLSVERA